MIELGKTYDEKETILSGFSVHKYSVMLKPWKTLLLFSFSKYENCGPQNILLIFFFFSGLFRIIQWVVSRTELE